MRLSIPSGFTLVELTVSMALIVMLMTIGYANYRTSQNQLRLRQAATDFVTALRQAQNYALAGTKVPATGAAAPGYGIDISPSLSYQVFADINNNSKFDSPSPDSAMTSPIARGSDVTLTTVVPSGDSCASSVSTIDVVFQPPLPTVTLNNGTSSCSKVCFFFQRGGLSWVVSVAQNSGLISSQLWNGAFICS